MAGYLLSTDGTLKARRTERVGNYWSGLQYSSPNGSTLHFDALTSVPSYIAKSSALPVRCIRDEVVIGPPTVSNVSIFTQGIKGLSTTVTATAGASATVTDDGGAEVVTRGFCWSISNVMPTIANDTIQVGEGTGTFSNVLKGLTQKGTIYVRAYAKNSKGIAYSPTVTSFKICPSEFEIYHKEGLNGSPVTKRIVYHSINSSITGSPVCWLTQNLGADSIPASASDKSDVSAGWYFQFNRQQGYQYTNDSRTPATTWQGINESSQWTAANDPCGLLLGTGWRLPTISEWKAADDTPQYWQKASDVYGSVLKLHMAGRLRSDNGSLENRGSHGYYWSSTHYSDPNGSYFDFAESSSVTTYISKSYAFPVRCVRVDFKQTIP
jgi:Fibrobacter succinogenes major domain (Fib_succ_major).